MRLRICRLSFAVLTFAILLPAFAQAQVPPRFYWKTLMGSNGVPVIYQAMSGNANPLDPARVVSADAAFSADLMIAGYAKMLPLFGRSGMVSVLVPTGQVSGSSTLAGNTLNQAASGYGDPMIECVINIIGKKPIMNMPEYLRYEPNFSLDFMFDVGIPLGEYNSDQAVNIGQNRWFGRVGAPIVWQLGAWVPGRRTTLEFLPVVWLFGDNDGYQGSSLLETEPMFQIDGHLTRDFTENFWASLDGVLVTGGKSSVNGLAGSAMNNLGLGYTLGYKISENAQLTLAYLATINDNEPDDLRMNGFRLSYVYGWHKLIEGMARLSSGE